MCEIVELPEGGEAWCYACGGNNARAAHEALDPEARHIALCKPCAGRMRDEAIDYEISGVGGLMGQGERHQ